MEKEIAEILRLFRLEPKKDVYARSLSGGMKRKLSVGIALIGGSKVNIVSICGNVYCMIGGSKVSTLNLNL